MATKPTEFIDNTERWHVVPELVALKCRERGIGFGCNVRMRLDVDHLTWTIIHNGVDRLTVGAIHTDDVISEALEWAATLHSEEKANG